MASLWGGGKYANLFTFDFGRYDCGSDEDSSREDKHEGIDPCGPSVLVLSDDPPGPASEDGQHGEESDRDAKDLALLLQCFHSLQITDLDSNYQYVECSGLII